MDYRFLGKTGLRISSLAMGTMSFGGDADEATSAKLFHRAREAGINLFDCADVYVAGESERILGRLIADCRDEIVLTTKAYFPTGSDVNARGASRYHLIRAVEASLRRLKTDRIDVFFLHRYDDATSLEETLRAVEHLVSQGKILHPAVSNYSAWQTSKALGQQRTQGWAPLVATQPMYNLLKRQAEAEILPMAADEGIAVFPYSPLAGGYLTGKYRSGARTTTGRIATNPMYSVRYAANAYQHSADRFVDFAEQRGLSPAALAIAWVMHHPAVTAPLIGARNLSQLEGSLAALDVDMTPELRAAVSALSDAPAPATDRNEETSSHNYGSR
ncbi:MAG: aldo/keto reductase [Myxococcales bacterium]|nr:aldo/keto reductase [Myxococcales bacterium]